MLVIYLGAVAISVFGPAPDEVLSDSAARGRQLEAAARAAATGDRAGATSTSTPTREIFPNLDAEQVGNVLMFLPFGILFPIAMPRLRWLTVPIAVTLSAGIETIQGEYLPWRTPSLADVGWNATGAVIGFAAWLWVRTAYRVLTDR